MDIVLKKGTLLLKAVVFYYHLMTELEEQILEDTAAELDAKDELSWAIEFINSDFPTSITRTREFLIQNLSEHSKDDKFKMIKKVWEDNAQKGFTTEIEAVTMLKVASDLGIVNELLALARNK